MGAEFGIECGHDPVVARQHFAGRTAVTRLIAIPQARSAEIQQHDEAGNRTDENNLFGLGPEH